MQLIADKSELAQRVEKLERHVSQLEVELVDSRRKERQLLESSGSGKAADLAAATASVSLKTRLEGVREWNTFMLSLLAEHEGAPGTASTIDRTNLMRQPAQYGRAGAQETRVKQLEQSAGLSRLDYTGHKGHTASKTAVSANEIDEKENVAVSARESDGSSSLRTLPETHQSKPLAPARTWEGESELQRVREQAAAAIAAANAQAQRKRQQPVEEAIEAVSLKLSPEIELSLSPEPQPEPEFEAALEPEPQQPLMESAAPAPAPAAKAPAPAPAPAAPAPAPAPAPQHDTRTSAPRRVPASPGAAEARVVVGSRAEQQRAAAVAGKSRRLEQARLRRLAAKAAEASGGRGGDREEDSTEEESTDESESDTSTSIELPGPPPAASMALQSHALATVDDRSSI